MGKELLVSINREKLQQDLIQLSPEDTPLIKDFIGVVFGPDIMKASSLKPSGLQTLWDKIKVIPHILPVLKTFIRYNQITLQQFSGRFKDPFLRETLKFICDAPGWPMPDFPMSVLTGFDKTSVREAGTPLGGSQQVAFHIAELYEKLGGEFRYKSKVTDLILEQNCVKGIRLADGSEFRADYVVWAADGHTLIFDILKGKFLNDKIRNMYKNWTAVKPLVHVMLGVHRDFSAEPHRMIIEMDQPLVVGGCPNHWMTVLHHCFDPSTAPRGKSALEVWFETNYEYWEELYKNKKEYKAEKQRIADITVQNLEKRWPGITEQVEVIDVPTPATYVRYTGNWKGSPDGWYMTSENFNKMDPVTELPGLSGLRMIGQWTLPYAGTIMSAITGRQIIQLLCRENKSGFVHSIKQ
jgi:phytoene dehydrogenase-like protein